MSLDFKQALKEHLFSQSWLSNPAVIRSLQVTLKEYYADFTSWMCLTEDVNRVVSGVIKYVERRSPASAHARRNRDRSIVFCYIDTLLTAGAGGMKISNVILQRIQEDVSVRVLGTSAVCVCHA